MFGAREYFSGRLFSQGIEGRFTSDSYQAFLQTILAHTKAHLFLIHDGARYHTSQATQQCLETHRERITASLLPSYSPDYHPIASLWKKTRKRATHNQYFKEFAALTVLVDKALAYCHASRYGVRICWALLRGKQLGTQTGRLDFHKQT